ncbi:MAG: YceI family protein [Gammaproteobacteria bacterium]|nr:YceI family protein [Gammaproteobacteria bacterium]
MSGNTVLKRMLVALVVMGSLSLGSANAEEEDLCSPFKNGKVDAQLLANMLDAADSGYLYRIKKDTSQVGFCVSSGWTEVKGNFHEFSGGLTLLPDDNVTGTSDDQAMLIIRTASLDTRSTTVENLIKGESFFDVTKYPEILFVSHGFEWTGRDTAKILGDLTVHGVTRPVTLQVTLSPVKQLSNSTAERVQVKAKTTIQRSDFDMHNMPGLVSDTVTLCISVEAIRYSG